jgi:hypothetical protein
MLAKKTVFIKYIFLIVVEGDSNRVAKGFRKFANVKSIIKLERARKSK